MRSNWAVVFAEPENRIVAILHLYKFACKVLVVILVCYICAFLNDYLMQALPRKAMVQPDEAKLTKAVVASIVAWARTHPRWFMRLPKRLTFSH